MNIEVRSVAEQERARVIAFLREEGYPRTIDGADRIYVSEVSGEIVAVARLAREGDVLVLRGMRVRRARQRQGIGRHLLAFLAKEIGSDVCYCVPFRWLVPFYGEVGFREVTAKDVPPFLAARWAEYVEDGQNVVLMRRDGAAPAPVHGRGREDRVY